MNEAKRRVTLRFLIQGHRAQAKKWTSLGDAAAAAWEWKRARELEKELKRLEEEENDA